MLLDQGGKAGQRQIDVGRKSLSITLKIELAGQPLLLQTNKQLVRTDGQLPVVA